VKIAIDVTPALPGGECGGAQQVLVELLRGFLRRAPEDRFLLLTAARNHDLFEEFELLGMERHMVFPDRAGLGRPAFWRRFIGRAAREFNARFPTGPLGRRGVDVLFCPMTAPYYAEAGVATVSVVHDLQHLLYPQFFSAVERRNRQEVYEGVRREADMVIAVSEFTRESVIRKLGLAPGRVVMIHNAVHARLSSLDRAGAEATLVRLGLEGKRYLFYPANLWPHKNHDMLLTALGIYAARRPGDGLSLVLTGAAVGGGAFLAEAIRRMGLGGRVRLLGYLSDLDLAAVWAGAYALVYPSLFEGFGIPLVEAMHFGKPILAGNLTSIPEVAGDAALYFDPRRPDEMGEAMERILDPAVAAGLVARGRERLGLFTRDRMVEAYLEVIRRAARLEQRRAIVNVEGFGDDGWAGPRIVIRRAIPGVSHELDIELDSMAAGSRMRIAVPGRLWRRVAADGEGVFRLRERLPADGRWWTLNIPGGRPTGDEDPRVITARVRRLTVTDAVTGEELYGFHG
jgi:glycosyltransferase involved in cell wall biosynthesis